MKTELKFWLSTSILSLFAIVLSTNCAKEESVTTETTLPIVTTKEATEVTQTTAISGGEISSDGGATITERGVCWSTSDNPTIADNKISDSTGIGSFSIAITGLTANTTYYVRAYATNSKGIAYGSVISFKTLEGNTNTTITYGSMTDIDDNSYKTVTIGTQTWMAENLKVTKYNDGASIPNVTDATAWDELTTGALCDYDNTPSNSETYGKLYNWHAVNTGKLCPTGWHVPSDAEWTQMENYLADNGHNYDETTGGGRYKIAKSLASTSGWIVSSTTGAVGNTDYPTYRNKSGFTALPGGVRNFNGKFSVIGDTGYWWSATEYSTTDALFRAIYYEYSDVGRIDSSKGVGFSVRCVRD